MISYTAMHVKTRSIWASHDEGLVDRISFSQVQEHMMKGWNRSTYLINANVIKTSLQSLTFLLVPRGKNVPFDCDTPWDIRASFFFGNCI